MAFLLRRGKKGRKRGGGAPERAESRGHSRASGSVRRRPSGRRPHRGRGSRAGSERAHELDGHGCQSPASRSGGCPDARRRPSRRRPAELSSQQSRRRTPGPRGCAGRPPLPHARGAPRRCALEQGPAPRRCLAGQLVRGRRGALHSAAPPTRRLGQRAPRGPRSPARRPAPCCAREPPPASNMRATTHCVTWGCLAARGSPFAGLQARLS